LQVVNFLIYVTFYPAGLSLILELMYTTDGRPGWDVRHIINTLPKEASQSPVVHHVRVTATSILMILHVLCRWPLVLPPRCQFCYSPCRHLCDNVFWPRIIDILKSNKYFQVLMN
jgi:hypothetical protein